MLLVTAINILTGPHTLTVLLEYINFFNLNHNGNTRQILGRRLVILDPGNYISPATILAVAIVA